MKSSVRGFFAGWKKLSLITLIVMLALVATIIQERTSFAKIDLLKEQKMLIDEITDLGRDETNKYRLEESSVQCIGKSKELLTSHDRLVLVTSYDFLGNFVAEDPALNSDEITSLRIALSNFIKAATSWYDHQETDNKVLEERREKMLETRYMARKQIDIMIENNYTLEAAKYQVQEILAYLSAFLFFVLFTLNLKRFGDIQKDIDSLYKVDSKAKEYVIVTEEIDILAKRMNRKPQNSDNPSLMDPLTEINNYKGFLQGYANKKSSKGRDFAAICLFCVDDFANIDRQYPKTLVQTVLKRAASNVHVYEQPNDVIGRTEANEFAIAVSRPSRDKAIKDCKDIMASFAEARFRAPDGTQLEMTMSCAFIPKMGKSTLEELMEQGREVLAATQSRGPNILLERKDLIDDE
jgi:diguanylate cyclase (GGDEF)-like protein